MHRLENKGRGLLLYGSLILMVWAAYEFLVMWNAMYGLIKTAFEISRAAEFPISQTISIMLKNSGRQFLTLFFLFLSFVFGLFALLGRRRPFLNLLSLIVALLFLYYLMGETDLATANFLQNLKAIPYAAIALGGGLGFAAYLARRRSQARSLPKGGQHPSIPYDPFGQNKQP